MYLILTLILLVISLVFNLVGIFRLNNTNLEITDLQKNTGFSLDQDSASSSSVSEVIIGRVKALNASRISYDDPESAVYNLDLTLTGQSGTNKTLYIYYQNLKENPIFKISCQDAPTCFSGDLDQMEPAQIQPGMQAILVRKTTFSGSANSLSITYKIFINAQAN